MRHIAAPAIMEKVRGRDSIFSASYRIYIQDQEWAANLITIDHDDALRSGLVSVISGLRVLFRR